MKNMAKQMELFEPVERGFEEGGLMDEGGTVDPVSGNEVPPGSTKEEVRDDVPAQLSEGEFVFPADVVRYIGLEKLMRMRQEAKMGLAAMEAMGQMGNSEEAVMPDDLPFDMYDLDIEEEDEYNMARGGVVKMQQGGTTYTPPSIGSFTPPPPVTTGFSGPQPVQPFQSGQGQFQVAGAAEGAVTPKTSIQGITPTFSEFVGMNVPGVDFKMVTFYDENGQAKVLKQFPDGSYEDPANPGVKVNPTDMGLTQEMKTETTPTQQRVKTAKVVDDGGKDDTPGRKGATTAFGGELVDGRVVGGYVGDLSFSNMSVSDIRSFYQGAVPSFLGQLAGKPNTNTIPDYAVATVKNLAVTRPEGVYSGPAKTVIAASLKMSGSAYNDLLTGQNVTSRKEMEAITDYIQEFYDEDFLQNPDNEIYIDREFRNRVEQVNDVKKQLEDNPNSDTYTVKEYDRDGNVSNVTEVTKDIADKVSQGVDLEAAAFESGFDFGGDDSSPSEPSGPDDAGSDPDDGSNPICLTENMKVKLNGVIDFVTNVKVGDIVDNTVVTEVLHKHMREGYYVVNGELEITNDHPVLASGSWKRTEDLVLGDYINNVEVTSLEYVEQVTPTVYIGTADDCYDVYTEGEVYTVHGQYKNMTKQAA